MAIYSKRSGIKGTILYIRDKRPCKTADVPANVVELLKTQPEVDTDGLQLQAPFHKCVFCKGETKLYRLVNQQTVYICEEHYYSRSMGQVAQQVRLNQESGAR